MEQEQPVVRAFDGKPAQTLEQPGNEGKIMSKQAVLIFIGIIILGIGTGFLLAPKKSDVTTVTDTTKLANLPKGSVFGSQDEKAFKDSAEGILREGGIEGEGSHRLERPGGESQNVYITSSVLDLNQLVGKKIKVWGQTNTAQTAGWLMDVGRAQIL